MAKPAERNAATAQRAPQSALAKLDSDFERLMEPRWPSLLNWPRLRELSPFEAPNVDVIDQETDIVVRAEVPGFKKEDLDVSVTDGSITIKASSSQESQKEHDGDYVLREISQGYLSRTVSLPSEVAGDKAKASYADGVLEVTVPKVARAKRQKIEIR